MSKYTTEVKFICENYAGLTESTDYKSINDVINLARPKLFDFNYPIFDNNYKNVLETKIIKHFYTREIGLETVALFKFKLDTKLNEIMPYYNKLYESELLEFNPLYSQYVERAYNKDGTSNTIFNSEESSESEDKNTGTVSNAGTSTDTVSSTTNTSNTSTDTSTSENKDRYSDTPQGGLNGIENNTYLTNARIVDNTTNNSGQSTTNSGITGSNNNQNSNTTTNNLTNTSKSSRDFDSSNDVTNVEEYTEFVKGYTTPAAELLLKFRETFLNIDMLIIADLEELFMQIW